MKEKRSKIREKLSLRAVGLILAMSMVAGTLLPVGVGAEELPVDINNEEITVADVMMYEDTDMSEDEEENEAAAETEEVIDVVSEENSEEAPAETSEPEAAEPETTESEVSEPEVTEPVETEPETTEPEVTEPEVPDFEETEPDEIITEEELPADAPEEEIYFCGIEEHEHTEECRNAPEEPDGEIIVEEEIPEEEPQPEEEPGELYCGYEVHVHDDACWNEEYLADCGMEEHEHSENCYSLAYTLMAEFVAAVELFPDEADYILLDFDEADGSELLDEEAYYAAYAAFYEENPDIWATTDALYNEASEAFDAENPEGDLDTWLQDNGFWEAAEKFYWIVPTPDAVAEKTAQMEEVELEFTEEEEAIVLAATEPPADKLGKFEPNINPNIEVNLFNYGSNINDVGERILNFMNSGDSKGRFRYLDGHGVYLGEYDSGHVRPVMKRSLVDGYPYVLRQPSKKKDGSDYATGSGSLKYLFDKSLDGKGLTGNGTWISRATDEVDENGIQRTSSTPDNLNSEFDVDSVNLRKDIAKFDSSTGYATAYRIMHHEMSEGDGGLFQRDENGYYFYDSAYNAAYYNGERFELYNCLIAPGHTAKDASGKNWKNFLPFDKPGAGYNSLTNDTTIFSELVVDEESGQKKDVYILGHSTGTTEETSAGPDLRESIVDTWYGMSVEFDFFKPKGGTINGKPMVFDFAGDDDVWLYIDGVLVLDIGGQHGAQSGTVNFKTGEVTFPVTRDNAQGIIVTNLRDLYILAYLEQIGEAVSQDDLIKDENGVKELDNKVAGLTEAEKDGLKTFMSSNGFEGDSETFRDYSSHSLKFFYMERGGNIGYCRLNFNMPTLPQNSLSVGKELMVEDPTGDGVADPYVNELSKNLSYEFCVWKTDEEGNILVDKDGNQILLVQPGTSFDIYEDGSRVGSSEVKNDGYFTLKAGQLAVFNNLLENYERSYYIVEERIPADFREQYGDIIIENSVKPVEIKDENGKVLYYGFRTNVQCTETELGSMVNIFNNTIEVDKLSTFAVEKVIAEGSKFDENEKFQFAIKFGGEPLANTKFKLEDGTEVYTDANGILTIKGGQRAKLTTDVISGTVYEVREVLANDDTTTLVFYDVTDDEPENIINRTKENLSAEHKITGDFDVDSDIIVTVTNSTYDIDDTYDLLVTKKITGNMGDINREFKFEAVIREYVSEQVVYSEAPVLLMSSADDIPAGDIGSVTDQLEFTLGHNDSYKIVGIPKGYVVTITEIDAQGYDTTIVWSDREVTYEEDAVERSLTTGEITTRGGKVVFTNDKTVTIDTAVHLDYLPYILILTAVIPTMTLAVSRKCRRRED